MKQFIVFLTGIISLALSGGATAYEQRHSAPIAAIDYQDTLFRSAHPFRVFIDLREARGQAPIVYSDHTLAYASSGLADSILLVNSPDYADAVLTVTQTSYTLGFRVIDVDQKDKKYKSSYKVSGQCGPYQKAYYTKTKEKGEAYAQYSVLVSLPAYGQTVSNITLRSAENFTYGTNLRASTACGIQPVQYFPSNSVAEIFSKATPSYRNQIADKIRREAAHDLGRNLRERINDLADQYYLSLAIYLSQPAVHAHPKEGYGKLSNYPTAYRTPRSRHIY